MTAEIYSTSQYADIAEPAIKARMRFKTRAEKWRDSEAKMKWVLRHDLSTPSEKVGAENWLRQNGFTR